jgi:hypothetical protein
MKPTTQAKARATSGALEIARRKVKRTLRKSSNSPDGSEIQLKNDAEFRSSVKAKKTLERKRNKERFKVK